ncbi:MAG: hypothetical protein JNM99_20485 [Verrucomicrobiaceae bacterium]|nr:hypothetical protein [Verrucomicrobiaceae bacterium]
MASADNLQTVSRFGAFMLAAGIIGLVSGTTLGKSGIIRLHEKRGEFYATCICHLALGLFCLLGRHFITGR